jgi:hypothetical protein
MSGEPVLLWHMERTKQLSVFLENKPGTLARVCEELSNQGINIYAMSVMDTIDHAIVRLIVSEPHKAVTMFEERGVLVSENDVLLLEGRNEPGSLATIAHKLADAQINIEYAYVATPRGETNGLLVLRTDKTDEAMTVLG